MAYYPNKFGNVIITGKFTLASAGGAESASGLLFGVGTSTNPATSSVAGSNFVELRTKSTATSGDNRSIYLRHELTGTGASGETIRALTKLSGACDTVRGAHVSLDITATTGKVTGLGVGVDGQIALPNAALPANGTYAVLNAEIYSGGSSTAVSAVTELSFLRVVATGNATGIGRVDDFAYFATFGGVAAGSGNMINTDITTHTAYGGLRVNIPGVGARYLALVSN